MPPRGRAQRRPAAAAASASAAPPAAGAQAQLAAYMAALDEALMYVRTGGSSGAERLAAAAGLPDVIRNAAAPLSPGVGNWLTPEVALSLLSRTQDMLSGVLAALHEVQPPPASARPRDALEVGLDLWRVACKPLEWAIHLLAPHLSSDGFISAGDMAPVAPLLTFLIGERFLEAAAGVLAFLASTAWPAMRSQPGVERSGALAALLTGTFSGPLPLVAVLFEQAGSMEAAASPAAASLSQALTSLQRTKLLDRVCGCLCALPPMPPFLSNTPQTEDAAEQAGRYLGAAAVSCARGLRVTWRFLKIAASYCLHLFEPQQQQQQRRQRQPARAGASQRRTADTLRSLLAGRGVQQLLVRSLEEVAAVNGGDGNGEDAETAVACGRWAMLHPALQPLLPKSEFAGDEDAVSACNRVVCTAATVWDHLTEDGGGLPPSTDMVRLYACSLRVLVPALQRRQLRGGAGDSGGSVLLLTTTIAVTNCIVRAVNHLPPAHVVKMLPDALEALAWSAAGAAPAALEMEDDAACASLLAAQLGDAAFAEIRGAQSRSLIVLVGLCKGACAGGRRDESRGWEAMDAAAGEDAARRLAAAGLLRSANAALRAAALQGDEPALREAHMCHEVMSHLLVPILRVVAPLEARHRAVAGDGASSASSSSGADRGTGSSMGGGGSSGAAVPPARGGALQPPLPPPPAWHPQRDLGVLVTACKLLRREVWTAQPAGAPLSKVALMLMEGLSNACDCEDLFGVLPAAPSSGWVAAADPRVPLWEAAALCLRTLLPFTTAYLTFSLRASMGSPSAAAELLTEAMRNVQALGCAAEVLPCADLLAAQPEELLCAVASVLDAAHSAPGAEHSFAPLVEAVLGKTLAELSALPGMRGVVQRVLQQRLDSRAPRAMQVYGKARDALARASASGTPDVEPPPPSQLWPPRVLRICANAACSNFDAPHEGALRLQRCGRCGVPRYCCTECQRQHWRGGHKAECEEMRAAVLAAAAPT